MFSLVGKSNFQLIIGLLLSALLLTACGGKNKSDRQSVAIEQKSEVPSRKKPDYLESIGKKEQQYSAQLDKNNNKSPKNKKQESIQTIQRDLSNPDYIGCKNSSVPSACISFQRKFQRDLVDDDLERKKYLNQRQKYLNKLNQADSLTQSDDQPRSSPRLVEQQRPTTRLSEQRRTNIGLDVKQPSLGRLGKQSQFSDQVDKQRPFTTGLDQRCRSFTGLEQRCRSIPNLGEQRPSVNGLDAPGRPASALDQLSPSALRRGEQGPARTDRGIRR